MALSHGQAGFTIIELMLSTTVVIVLAGMAVLPLTTGIDANRAEMAAWTIAARFRLNRMEAVKRSAAVGVRFRTVDEVVRFATYVDGNRNGIRSADIRRGLDRPLHDEMDVGDQFPGVRFGIARTTPAIDDGAELTAGSDPIRFGPSDIVTFTPAGTASAGTVYLRSPRGRQYAVRVLGATGRTRIFEFNAGEGRWIAR